MEAASEARCLLTKLGDRVSHGQLAATLLVAHDRLRRALRRRRLLHHPRVLATSRGYRPGDAPWNREIRPDTDLVRAVAEARSAGATSIKLYAQAAAR